MNLTRNIELEAKILSEQRKVLLRNAFLGKFSRDDIRQVDNAIEKVQKDFISQIKDPSLDGKNYWEKLSLLGVTSQERRREKQQICFIWKLSQGLVDGYSVSWTFNERRGRLAVPKPIKNTAPAKVRNARESSLAVHGVKLFNLLPASLRNEDSGDVALFMNHLDIYLSEVPDQPTVTGMGRAAKSNSLVDQIPLWSIDNFTA